MFSTSANRTPAAYGNAVVWMDKRSSSLCNQVLESLGAQLVERVGIYVIPNTSAMHSGMAKNTYGTGSFLLMNTGTRYIPPANGLFSPLLWGNREAPTYGLEGFSENCGTAIDWLKTRMGLVDEWDHLQVLREERDV